MIKSLTSFLIIFLIITKAVGQDDQYDACMAKVKHSPKEAFEDALQWRDFGNTWAAEHCASVALISLGLNRDAAVRLENLAAKANLNTDARATIFGQAAQAWLLANSPSRAKILATKGLKLNPGNIELLIDRAQAHAGLKDYIRAKSDLDAVITKKPKHIEALTFRASTKRFLGDNKGALLDIERALALNIAHVPALLERGNLRRLKGDKKGARADWLMVLSFELKGASAIAARHNLEKMDVTINK